MTDQISIYNWNNTDASDLKITVRNDSNYEALNNVYAKLQRYYIGENVWRTVQMDKTGECSDYYSLISSKKTRITA